jgi:hypothetical protein
MTPSAREPHDEQVSEANLVAQVKTYEALVAALDRGQEVFDALASADDGQLALGCRSSWRSTRRQLRA